MLLYECVVPHETRARNAVKEEPDSVKVELVCPKVGCVITSNSPSALGSL